MAERRTRRAAAEASAPAEDEGARTFPPPPALDGEAAAVWTEVVDAHHEPARIVGPNLEAYCAQVAIQRDARRRIAAEGAIVSDERDRPVPHPAIEIERKAQAEIRAWGDTFRGRAPRPAGGGRRG